MLGREGMDIVRDSSDEGSRPLLLDNEVVLVVRTIPRTSRSKEMFARSSFDDN